MITMVFVAACDPTDPQNNGVRYWLYNSTTRPLNATYCVDDCSQVRNASSVPSGWCLSVLVGKGDEVNNGSTWGISSVGERRPSAYVLMAAPHAGNVFDISKGQSTAAFANASPLSQSPHRC